MKRMHIHVRVEDLGASIKFYEAVFGTAPTVKKTDYAKWRLEDPVINFAISEASGQKIGIDHIGVQAETEGALQGLHDRLKAAQVSMFDEEAANCCYAVSDKHWASDPNGVVWEMFKTMGEIEVYGEDQGPVKEASDGACCRPN
jgi:hypothetical protein